MRFCCRPAKPIQESRDVTPCSLCLVLVGVFKDPCVPARTECPSANLATCVSGLKMQMFCHASFRKTPAIASRTKCTPGRSRYQVAVGRSGKSFSGQIPKETHTISVSHLAASSLSETRGSEAPQPLYNGIHVEMMHHEDPANAPG